MGVETAAVLAIIENYVLGTRTRDEALLRSIFHDEAQMFGRIGARDVAAPILSYIAHAATSDPGETYEATIRGAEVFGSSAVAVLEERNYQGLNFLDYFSLVEVGGAWVIVTKLFGVVE